MLRYNQEIVTVVPPGTSQWRCFEDLRRNPCHNRAPTFDHLFELEVHHPKVPNIELQTMAAPVRPSIHFTTRCMRQTPVRPSRVGTKSIPQRTISCTRRQSEESAGTAPPTRQRSNDPFDDSSLSNFLARNAPPSSAFQKIRQGRERARTGFWSMFEETEDMGEDEPFLNDDLSSIGHGELEQHRELREFARIVAWEMPLLSSALGPQ